MFLQTSWPIRGDKRGMRLVAFPATDQLANSGPIVSQKGPFTPDGLKYRLSAASSFHTHTNTHN